MYRGHIQFIQSTEQKKKGSSLVLFLFCTILVNYSPHLTQPSFIHSDYSVAITLNTFSERHLITGFFPSKKSICEGFSPIGSESEPFHHCVSIL